MTAATFDFTLQKRLNKPSQYKQVFTNPIKNSDAFFTVLAIKNDLNHCRLGLAITKKNIKKASDRNRIKRLIRESFRLSNLINTNSLDLVVLARREVINTSSEKLRHSLEKHWQKITRR